MENLYSNPILSTEPETSMNDEVLARLDKNDAKLLKLKKHLKKKKKKVKNLKRKLKKQKKQKKGKRVSSKRDVMNTAIESLPAALYLADTVLKRKKRREE